MACKKGNEVLINRGPQLAYLPGVKSSILGNEAVCIMPRPRLTPEERTPGTFWAGGRVGLTACQE